VSARRGSARPRSAAPPRTRQRRGISAASRPPWDASRARQWRAPMITSAASRAASIEDRIAPPPTSTLASVEESGFGAAVAVRAQVSSAPQVGCAGKVARAPRFLARCSAGGQERRKTSQGVGATRHSFTALRATRCSVHLRGGKLRACNSCARGTPPAKFRRRLPAVNARSRARAPAPLLCSPLETDLSAPSWQQHGVDDVHDGVAGLHIGLDDLSGAVWRGGGVLGGRRAASGGE